MFKVIMQMAIFVWHRLFPRWGIMLFDGKVISTKYLQYDKSMIDKTSPRHKKRRSNNKWATLRIIAMHSKNLIVVFDFFLLLFNK